MNSAGERSARTYSRKLTIGEGREVPAETRLCVFAPAVGDLDGNPYRAYIARLSSVESRRAMQGCLDGLAAMFMPLPPGTAGVPGGFGERMPWWQLRYEDTNAVLGILTERVHAGTWSASHVNKHLSALRRVLWECWRLGLLTSDARDRACDIEGIDVKKLSAGRHVASSEFSAMLAACHADPNEPLGLRDAAVIAFLEATGARRAEAASMLIQRHFHRDRSVRVTGKGSKERDVPLHASAVTELDRWIAVLGQRSGPVFRAVDKWGNIGSRALSPRAIGIIITRRREQCGLDPMTTHDPRRTLVTNLLDTGTDLLTVSEIVGHSRGPSSTEEISNEYTADLR
jgi:site-specific recombinase XerD